MLPVPEGLQAIAQHRGKIAVLSVVGPYHSGKSFLLNALLGEPDVFSVGRQTSPETMGIWMCRTNLVASDGSEVWLLDSEGFFGPGVSESYDAKIFTIASLLGGHLVYNTVKIIDNQAVSLLEMLARRAQLFRTRSSKEIGAAETPEFLSVRNFPPLTWVVEDFVQELPEEHRLGEDGATAWLRSYMTSVEDRSQTSPKPGASSDDSELQEDGEDSHFLARLYSSLKVHTLFLPATSKEHLQDLSKLQWDELTPEFRDEVASLKKHVLEGLEARRFEEAAMTGETLERSLRFIVQALQRGMFHELPSLWATWTTQVAEVSLQDAQAWFASLLVGVDDSENPIPVALFNELVEEARGKAVSFYKDLLRDFDVTPNLGRLQDQMASHFQHKMRLWHERILRWVSESVTHAKEQVARVLDVLVLPMNPDELKRAGENASKIAVKEFSTQVQTFAVKSKVSLVFGRAAQMPAFPADPVAQLTSDLRNLIGSRENDNEREIAAIFKVAVDAADEIVDSELKTAGNNLLGNGQLKDLSSVVAEKCWKTFNDQLASNKWLMDLNHYRTNKALVEAEMYQRRMTRFAAGNQQKLSTHFRTSLERCASAYKARKANLAMPVSEIDLEAEHRTLAGSIRDMLDEQAGAGGELKDTDSYRGAHSSLTELLAEGAQHAQKKNVELWKVHLDEATRCALIHNEDVMRRCGFTCLFNKVPAVHKSTSQRHLTECLPRSGAGSRMSLAMQAQVFNDWYSKDLAHDTAMVWFNFYAGTIVLGALVLALITSCQCCSSRQSQYYGPGGPTGYQYTQQQPRWQQR